MYLPELGCDAAVIQECQKEEVEALKPKEQDSSTFNHNQKEKHRFFLFPLMYFLCVLGLILQWDESYVSLLLLSKKLRYIVGGNITN